MRVLLLVQASCWLEIILYYIIILPHSIIGVPSLGFHGRAREGFARCKILEIRIAISLWIFYCEFGGMIYLTIVWIWSMIAIPCGKVWNYVKNEYRRRICFVLLLKNCVYLVRISAGGGLKFRKCTMSSPMHKASTGLQECMYMCLQIYPYRICHCVSKYFFQYFLLFYTKH